MTNLIKELKNQLFGVISDGFLESMLWTLKMVLHIDRLRNGRLWRNIQGFEGCIAFSSTDGKIHGSAIFSDNKMTSSSRLISKESWEMSHEGAAYALLTFKDASSLRSYLFNAFTTKDTLGDILEPMLEDKVQVTGNLNLLYRFGYLTNEVTSSILGVIV